MTDPDTATARAAADAAYRSSEAAAEARHWSEYAAVCDAADAAGIGIEGFEARLSAAEAARAAARAAGIAARAAAYNAAVMAAALRG